MDIAFNSLEELYNRLKPALIAKKEEIHRNGYNYIKEEDIWNYLKEVKWKQTNNLELYQMVSDVFNTDNNVIDFYLKEKLNMRNRKVYFSEDDVYEKK